MARRKAARRSRRSSFRGFARRAKRTTSHGKILQLDAMAYGAIRSKTSDMLVPYTQGMLGGFGQLSDEVTMGVLSWAAAKYGSGFVKNIGEKGLVIENARVGEALVNGGLSLGNTTTSNSW